MANLIGKINLSRLIGMKIADVDYGEICKKCVVIPIEDNNIIQWNDEMQLWFRTMRYKEPRGRFTHFIMKYIPRNYIKRFSQNQIEQMTNIQIGGMISLKKDTREPDIIQNDDEDVE